VNKTSIEWVRNPDGTQGYTWNPITGCLNGCPYCYARTMARNGRVRPLYLANSNVAKGCDPTDPFAPRLWTSRFRDVTPRQQPRGIFTCDMGELFGPWLYDHWTPMVLGTLSACPQHRFYLLTKQPQELQKWSPFPENAWVGVSAWDHASFVNACHYLEGIQASVKYVSLEPLLDWILELDIGGFCRAAGVSWVIVGAQTKPTIVPNWKWLEDIVRRCTGAGVAVFLKESLRYMVDDGGPHEPCFWPDKDDPYTWNLLQEFPDNKVLVWERHGAKVESRV